MSAKATERVIKFDPDGEMSQKSDSIKNYNPALIPDLNDKRYIETQDDQIKHLKRELFAIKQA